MANLVKEVKTKLAAEISAALEKSQDAGDLSLAEIPEIMLEEPREEAHGDYATNIAMVLAGQAQRAPREIAQLIVDNLADLDLIAQVEVAGPGFINFYLSDQWLYEAVETILEMGDDYGSSHLGQDKKVQIEFVSANPTGPLHIGHSRGAVVGDVLANIMSKVGFDVTKEYYINDAGNQMELLGQSVALRYQELFGAEVELPENSYQGEYIKEIAEKIKNEYGKEHLSKVETENYDFFKEFAYQRLLENIENDLREFGVEFDNWFSERTLHNQGLIKEVIEDLKEDGYLYEREGALWFKSSELGDDKDRVVVKEDGSTTYLAADIAYHQHKYQRGFTEVINVWGADHHGYVERMKAVIEALGYQREMLEVIIVQMVTLLREGKQVSMSKRSGDFVTLQDVVAEVGKDAARYFYIRRSVDSHLEFDLDLAKKESTENPVYYIQYAHARICSILAQPEIKELDLESDFKLNNLTDEAELKLMQQLARFTEELEKSAESRAPHHIARYAYDLAATFHTFYNKCIILGEEELLMLSRVSLVLATKQVLCNVLSILGVSAPESM
ncbi:arginine--tRNA ligase [Fuchsiella alkaliacetigena]|uniref:arginine--tRNA ligase n=1 Tax=Fuchsiella alkaliacetigena TaxID=957042 RepID=UPI00200B4345|nr:arginine--tRNA ligase [Fuchsiella alkaliacetigena]MCK8824610.1 arginine--tRNA ligase [Fuchsiella alkaliacetigena]